MSNQQVVTTWIQAISSGHAKRVAALTSHAFALEHDPSEPPLDRAGFVQATRAIHRAFPDLTVQPVDRPRGRGDVLQVDLALTGTHRHPLDLTPVGRGWLPATGASIPPTALPATVRVKAGRVHRTRVDLAPHGGIGGLLTSLASAPPTGSTRPASAPA